MVLNSPMHEAYLDLPLDAQMMPELETLPFWARTTHEIMLAVNPQMMKDLAEKNTLRSFLDQQQIQLSEEARELEKEWRRQNPLPATASYLDRMPWIQHAKLSAREILIERIHNRLSAQPAES